MKKIYYPYGMLISLFGETKTNKEVTYHLNYNMDASGWYNNNNITININLKFIYDSFLKMLKTVHNTYNCKEINYMFIEYIIYGINHEFMHYLLHKEFGNLTSIAFDNLYINGVSLTDAINKFYGGI